MGVDDANLLRASLQTNHAANKMFVAKCKILWSHARGDLNIGESSIAACCMPRILARFGDYSDSESNANLIQYHEPAMAKTNLNAIRLGSIHHILRAWLSTCMRKTAKDTSLMERRRDPAHYFSPTKRNAGNDSTDL